MASSDTCRTHQAPPTAATAVTISTSQRFAAHHSMMRWITGLLRSVALVARVPRVSGARVRADGRLQPALRVQEEVPARHHALPRLQALEHHGLAAAAVR